MQIGCKLFDFTRPVIMGVLNVTPDSFSDGGNFLDPDTAVNYAMRLIEEGADIIDIGGESSRPGSDPVPAEIELKRVIPVIKAIRKRGQAAFPISIDTTKARVAVEAIDAGANMINDISAGTFDKEMFSVAAKVPIVLMHMRGTPRMMQRGEIHYDDVVGEVCSYLGARISESVKAGIKDIIIDPGIGFGKTVEHNVTILKELGRLKTLGRPILIGTSRKSFIGKLLNDSPPTQRLEGTLATLAVAVRNGASILRVHDVASAKRFLEVSLTIC